MTISQRLINIILMGVIVAHGIAIAGFVAWLIYIALRFVL